MALDHRQKTAAEMLGRGHSQRQAGAAVNRSDRWVREQLKETPGFRALVDAIRRETPHPEAVDALRLALTAVKADGITPDHQVRVAAARALRDAVPPAPDPDSAPGGDHVMIFGVEDDPDHPGGIRPALRPFEDYAHCPQCPHCQAEEAATRALIADAAEDEQSPGT